jgi:uncharacterized membrane protein
VADSLENLFNHLHGAINHFPIALLFVSAGLDFVAGKRPDLRSTAWLLLVLGTLGAIAASVSGLLAHLAYEDDPTLHSPIEVHQYLAFATTALFAALTTWRWRSLRLGSDVGGTRVYLALVILGLVVLGVTGFLGGNLLTEWGIGVKNVTR